MVNQLCTRHHKIRDLGLLYRHCVSISLSNMVLTLGEGIRKDINWTEYIGYYGALATISSVKISVRKENAETVTNLQERWSTNKRGGKRNKN
jgi:RNA binding exosome subunit